MKLSNLTALVYVGVLIMTMPLPDFAELRLTSQTFHKIFRLIPAFKETIFASIPKEIDLSIDKKVGVDLGDLYFKIEKEIKTEINLKTFELDYGLHKPPFIIDKHSMIIGLPAITIDCEAVLKVGKKDDTIEFININNIAIRNLLIIVKVTFKPHPKTGGITLEVVRESISYDSIELDSKNKNPGTIAKYITDFINYMTSTEMVQNWKSSLVDIIADNVIAMLLDFFNIHEITELMLGTAIAKIGLNKLPRFYKLRGESYFILSIGAVFRDNPDEVPYTDPDLLPSEAENNDPREIYNRRFDIKKLPTWASAESFFILEDFEELITEDNL